MRAQRRKQTRLVGGTVSVILLALVVWQGYEYVASAPERAEARVQAGIKFMSPGHYEEAAVQFSEALETDPNSWNGYLQRGLAKQNMSRPDDAMADLQAALRIKPDLPEARAALAGMYGDKGDFPQEIEELTKAIELKPTVDAYSRRALAHAELGQHEAAIADFTWVIDTIRDAPLSYFGRAKSKRALGDLEGASSDEKTAKTFGIGIK
jgi:tetratricopeptide (TPR) repeat protein